MDRLLTRREAAELLRVSTSTIRRWDDGGLIKLFKAPGRRGRVIYRLEPLEAFVRRFEEQPLEGGQSAPAGRRAPGLPRGGD